MAILLVVGVPVLLLSGFLALTQYETTAGTRFFEDERSRFDRFVTRWLFVYEHVDFVAFFRDIASMALHHVGHTLTHVSLQVVRWVERLLTRLIRFFHAREAALEPRESTRAFVKTLSDFKEHLRATAPQEVREFEG
jgi:hypothetical protein